MKDKTEATLIWKRKQKRPREWRRMRNLIVIFASIAAVMLFAAACDDDEPQVHCVEQGEVCERGYSGISCRTIRDCVVY